MLPIYTAVSRSAVPRCLSTIFSIITAFIVATYTCSSARAGTLYWDVTEGATWDTTVSPNWSTSSGGGNDGLFIAGSDAVFSSTEVTDQTAGALGITTTNLSANSITFNSTDPDGYTFSADGALTIGNAAAGNSMITLNAGAAPVTFNGRISPAAGGGQTYTITNNSSNLLTFGGVFGGSGNSYTVAITGTGTGGVTFNGTVEGNSGNSVNGGVLNLNVSGGGLVSLNAANFNAGALTLNTGGQLILGNSLALQASALNLMGGRVQFRGIDLLHHCRADRDGESRC